MIEKLNTLTDEFEALERSLADPALIADTGRYREAMQRYSELKGIVDAFREYRDLSRQLAEARELEADPELGEEASAETARLQPRVEGLEHSLERMLLPRDPFDDKDVIVEIRAAAGGDEASLYAREVLDLYLRYAESLGYATELLDSHPTDVGGLSKVSFEIHGRGAYSRFKFESGVHRVQRVPATEAQGRIHTSTVTVAVLPEAEDVDVNLSPSDYRVDVYRSSGPGGQSVNTTDSAVRVTYLPGTPEEIVVTCQDGKSQIKNKEKALAVLRARLLERERERALSEAREARLVQIGSGERSEKVRTYNFPQSRVTDHRIGYTTRDLQGVLLGGLEELTAALSEAEQGRRLEEMTGASSGGEAAAAGGAA
ncbi:MAG: peptide chain release factor 1 [Deinococcales bacterium]